MTDILIIAESSANPSNSVDFNAMETQAWITYNKLRNDMETVKV